MGARLICKNCDQHFSRNQFVHHQIHCVNQKLNKKRLKKCKFCSKTFQYSEYHEHVLTHIKNEPNVETTFSPTVTFCDYNFSSSMIQRVTRFGQHIKYLSFTSTRENSNNYNVELIVNLSLAAENISKELVPVDEDLLKLMPVEEIQAIDELENKTCIICMKDYEVKDKVLTTPCSHSYHNECINGWFKKCNKCPVCKFKIEKEIIQTNDLLDDTCK